MHTDFVVLDDLDRFPRVSSRWIPTAALQHRYLPRHSMHPWPEQAKASYCRPLDPVRLLPRDICPQYLPAWYSHRWKHQWRNLIRGLVEDEDRPIIPQVPSYSGSLAICRYYGTATRVRSRLKVPGYSMSLHSTTAGVSRTGRR